MIGNETLSGLSSAVWKKSSWSAENGYCVEVAQPPGNDVGVRDSKDTGSGPVLIFTCEDWKTFL